MVLRLGCDRKVHKAHRKVEKCNKKIVNATYRGAKPPSQYELSWKISLFNFVNVKALYLPPLEVTFKFRLCHQLNVGEFELVIDLGEGSFAAYVGKM
jgi:hypothetical protein